MIYFSKLFYFICALVKSYFYMLFSCNCGTECFEKSLLGLDGVSQNETYILPSIAITVGHFVVHETKPIPEFGSKPFSSLLQHRSCELRCYLLHIQYPCVPNNSLSRTPGRFHFFFIPVLAFMLLVQLNNETHQSVLYLRAYLFIRPRRGFA